VPGSCVRRSGGEGVPGPSWHGQPSLIEGADPRLSSETHSLRRARVRAAALFLTLTLTATLVWRSLTVGGALLYLQAGVICGLGAALAVLWSKLALSAREVRALEFLFFGLTAFYLSARQYQQLTVWAPSGDEASLILAVKSTLFGTALLALAYAMLIPNTWRDA